MHHYSERSVDEILKAIQKVIESDNRDSAQADRRQRENDGVMLNSAGPRESVRKADENEFLITSDMATDDEKAGILDLGTGATALPDQIEPDQHMTDQATPHEEDAPEQASAKPAAKSAIPPERIIAQIEETLTSERAAEAMRRSLSNLSRLSDASEGKTAPSGETTIEQLVRDMLRPMLAQWLDAHLPPLVEQMVKAEIARISTRRS